MRHSAGVVDARHSDDSGGEHDGTKGFHVFFSPDV